MLSHKCLKSVVMFGICVVGSVSGASAQGPSGQGEVGWVGLYNTALIEWLENENRLQALCSHTAADTPKWHECRDEKMKPKRHLFQLRSAPQETATPEGTLIILATPSQRLRAYYRPVSGGRETGFVPDLFDADWGYGPYFHQTFLEQRGTWFLLPSVPLPRPAWVNITEPHVRLVRELHEARDVIKTPKGDLIVLSMDRRVLRARLAQDADQWCKGGDPPPLKPWKEIRLPVEKLYGPTGHLLISIKYKRGC